MEPVSNLKRHLDISLHQCIICQEAKKDDFCWVRKVLKLCLKENLKMKLFTEADDISIVEQSVPELLNLIAHSPERGDDDDPFFVVDLGDIIHKYETWLRLLPRVKPFYAVKCCPEPVVLRLLESLGVNFDCASKSEIRAIEAICPDAPKRIIFANAIKMRGHLKYAAKNNIDLMTFDCIEELVKIKEIYPEARIILRIKIDNKESGTELGKKFGATLKIVPELLVKAKYFDLNVVGVSFHVGSECRDSNAYKRAISDSKWVFEEAKSYGYNMKLLDIGGGYPGDDSASVKFVDVARVINEALDKHFPVGCNIDIIAEPGRYFVSSAFTLCVNIICKKTEQIVDNNGKTRVKNHYHVSEGVYGSLSGVKYNHRTLLPYSLKKRVEEKLIRSTIWGPTCDSIDEITDCDLPELKTEDWLVFDNVGAYTISAFSGFNGFERPHMYYCSTSFYRPYLTKHGVGDKVYTEEQISKI
ncbi:Antizyme inhibitor 2 [Nymphon striatum]|nr:Antizyme inhibitor 2 [Nymphon striatum]